MQIVYDITSLDRYRGSQNKKVFIYVDGEFDGYLWMSDDDLKKNIAQDKADGDEAEIKKSYLDERDER